MRREECYSNFVSCLCGALAPLILVGTVDAAVICRWPMKDLDTPTFIILASLSGVAVTVSFICAIWTFHWIVSLLADRGE